jgi:hypothetical protein
VAAAEMAPELVGVRSAEARRVVLQRVEERDFQSVEERDFPGASGSGREPSDLISTEHDIIEDKPDRPRYLTYRLVCGVNHMGRDEYGARVF